MASFYFQLVQQATTLAYIDVLRVLGFTTALIIPLLLLTKKAKSSESAHVGN